MPPNPDLQPTPAGYFKTLSVIHLALVIGQVMFAIVSLFLTKKIMINVRFSDDPLVVIVPLTAICGFVISNVLFKRQLRNIGKSQNLRSKLMAYQNALILRLAVLEMPSLLGITAFLLTGILFFLLVSVLIIGYFIYIRPAKDRIVDYLALGYQEQDMLNNLNEVLR